MFITHEKTNSMEVEEPAKASKIQTNLISFKTFCSSLKDIYVSFWEV